MIDLMTRPAPAAAPPAKGYAPLTNMSLAMRTLVDCMEAGDQLPRLGLLYGNSGFGKTVAAAFAAARTNAGYICAQSIWTQRTLLEAIAEELGIVKFERTAPRLLRQIVDELNRAPRPLIVDEMDYLVKKQSVEIIRDIHDATGIAIMMIGEEALPAKLKEWERFDNRILVATAAQPASDDDALLLRDHYGFRDMIADDLATYIAGRCKGVTRRIVNNLQHVARTAATEGVDRIDRAWWGHRSLSDGDLPTRRSMGA
jgi:DNA transposition AAA+ family ATPase